MEFDFKTIFRQLGFGDPTAQPQRVTGGYLHKMFQVETPSGKYAVKLLNPLIMKRPGIRRFQPAVPERAVFLHI